MRSGDCCKSQTGMKLSFDLRFLRPFCPDFSIKKSSSFFPPLIAATSHLGLAPLPAQVSSDGLRYVEPHHELIQCSK